MRSALLLSAVLGLLAACGPRCQRSGGALGSCRIEWVCGADTYVAECNPDCVCLKNGTQTGPLGANRQDWCSATDPTEKTSFADGRCGWGVPLGN